MGGGGGGLIKPEAFSLTIARVVMSGASYSPVLILHVHVD